LSTKALPLNVRFTDSIKTLSWSAPLGLVTATNIDTAALQKTIASVQANPLHDADRLAPRMQAFERFFVENGFKSPLSAQFAQIQRKGLPPAGPMVQALLLAETRTGLLMGAQDAAAIRGELIYDLAQPGEIFAGMRSEVRCRENEIILRDHEGIIASLLQGPDNRTRLTKNTSDVVFFIFSVPAISATDLQEGAELVCSILRDSCEDCQFQVYQHAAVSDSQP
jgi:DNA/RNA-binding domain of Phe-tRNA-synthetase-like protein